ncbi:unnamed protein product [Cylindrotheca closterium]|uniref:Uncharacterized protein n=1 Tax=Cylindrotheca closterium TaxID=2856 RepID=A0AAD2CV36_9STRA|nr:unnamed protein product [Cylindrotheca closterium]
MISDITKILQEAPAPELITSDTSSSTRVATKNSSSTSTLLSSTSSAAATISTTKHPQEEFTLREKLGPIFSLLTFDPKKVTNWAHVLH